MDGIDRGINEKTSCSLSLEMAQRLIQMFSFVGDVVFIRSWEQAQPRLARSQTGRNSVGCEIYYDYFRYAEQRIKEATSNWFSTAKVAIHG